MAVGWQLPNGTLERPIPGSRLSPFESQAMAMNGLASPMTTQDGNPDFVTEDLSTDVDVFPNPAESGASGLTISGNGMAGGSKSKIEIQRMTGEIVYSKEITCDGGCETYSLPVDRALAPGVYMVNVITNGKRSSKRLLVK
jgi:hypothetical protein